MGEPAGREEAAVNHVGLCVADIERSRRFYQEVLGFRSWWDLAVPDESASRLLQLPAPLGVRAAYLAHDGLVLELIHFAAAPAGPQRRRRMNDPGLTHLSVAVADIPAVLEKVVPYGGQILEDTDMGGLAVMIRDPDGQLVELTTFGFRASRPPYPGADREQSPAVVTGRPSGTPSPPRRGG